VLGDILQQISEIFSRRRPRKRLIVAPIEFNRFFHDLAKFLKDSLLVVAVAAPEH